MREALFRVRNKHKPYFGQGSKSTSIALPYVPMPALHPLLPTGPTRTPLTDP
jgi:hypothetical protein